MKKIARRGAIVLAMLIGLRILAGYLWPSLNINDVTTGVTAEYPDLRPQTFPQSYEHVFDAAAAIGRAQGWEVTREDRVQGIVQAIATTRLWHFKDDVTITITHQGAGAKVSIRSHSRVGKGDLGANAKRIRLFQAALATRLSGG